MSGKHVDHSRHVDAPTAVGPDYPRHSPEHFEVEAANA